MKVIDLTGPLTSEVWTYGEPLPPVEVGAVARIEEHGWSGHRLNLHTLSGTYLETAAHVFASREDIAEVSPDRFVREAWVVHVPDKMALEPITRTELEYGLKDAADLRSKALLVATGWDRQWSSTWFVDQCPFFTDEAMDFVMSLDVDILGLDVPCVQDPRHDDGTLVRRFFQRDRLLLAPVINLRNAATGPYTLVSLPLKIPGVCGTPCRAILVEI